MLLDLSTSLSIVGFTSAVAGCLLLISWLQNRHIQALIPWGLTFLSTAVWAWLAADRGAIPDIWSIAIANAVLALGYGAMWSGVRMFQGRRPYVLVTVTGASIWLLACTFESFYSVPTARIALMSTIGMAYSLLAMAELWAPRNDALASRWLIIGLLLVHTIALPLRIPLVGSLVGSPLGEANLLTIVTFEAVLVSMCGAYLFGSLAKEQIALSYKRASLMDPLTGVANRRAFLKRGAKLVRRSLLARQRPAVLLFDLDNFKRVNDSFGHSVGDGVLTTFCRVAQEHLRATDFFARLGGEEFACLLPDSSPQDAAGVAERVRCAFETTRHRAGQEPFATTVSVGVAVAEDSDCILASLLETADRALYCAKQDGRNRVALAG